MKRTKQNTLKASWSKKEKDIMFNHPDGNQTKADGHLLYSRFCAQQFNYDGKPQPSFVKELEDRGYDVSTLIFSICKKEDHPRWK